MRAYSHHQPQKWCVKSLPRTNSMTWRKIGQSFWSLPQDSSKGLAGRSKGLALPRRSRRPLKRSRAALLPEIAAILLLSPITLSNSLLQAFKCTMRVKGGHISFINFIWKKNSSINPLYKVPFWHFFLKTLILVSFILNLTFWVLWLDSFCR